MTVGSPDYGITSTQTNESPSTDVLELASRLGSIAAINRTGQQIISIADTIAYGSTYWSPDGYGGYIIPSSKFAYYGRPSLKIVSGLNASGGGGITFNHLPFQGSEIGIETLCIAGSFAMVLTIDFKASINSILYHTQLQINLSNGAISLLNSSGLYDSIGTFPVPNGLGMPFSIKYTFNLDTGKYGFLFYGSESITSLQAHSFQNLGASSVDFSLYTVSFANNGVVSNTLYIQDVITTINEVV